MNSFDIGNQSTDKLDSFPKAIQLVNDRAELTNPGNGNPPAVPASNCVKSNCGNLECESTTNSENIEEAGGEVSGQLSLHFPWLI